MNRFPTGAGFFVAPSVAAITALVSAEAVVNAGVEVTLSVDGGEPVDAGSALMIMTLGAGNGAQVTVSSGDEGALATVAELLHKDLDVGHNAAGLFGRAGETTPVRRRVLDPAIYREAATRLDRHFTIVVADRSSTMDSPVTQEVLRDLDTVVVVSSPWVDGAAAAGQTLDWLGARGMTTLLQRTVVVLNDSDGHADKRTRSLLAQQFSGQGQLVVEVPFDGSLRPGGVIDGTAHMSRAARRKLVELCAALSGFFPRDGRPHDWR